jgi:hypothetical protein
MLSRIRRLPTPALIIASIALILAVGGGTAAIALTDHEKKVVKKIAKRVANKQITRRAHTLQVKHARIARRAKTADTINGVNVKVFAAKAQPNQPGVVLVDTGIATLRGTCDGGQHAVLLSKDAGAPPLVMGSNTGIGNSDKVDNRGAADFSGTQHVDAGAAAGASIGHAEVMSTSGVVNTFNFLGRDAKNFSPGENVCTFSGSVIFN